MSQTYVVRTVSGTWVMGCCDDLHGMYDQPDAEFATRAAAERAARRHRAEDRAERDLEEARIARCCPTCGTPR